MNSKAIVIILVVLVLLGVGGYMLMNRGVQPEQSETAENSPEKMMEQNQMTEDKSATDSSGSAMTGTSMDDAVKEFTVTGSSFKFEPNKIEVNKGDKVKITFKNAGGFHDFMIDEFKVAAKQIGSGASETVEFTADKAGTFEFYCSVGNHRAQGMKGTLVVK